MPMSSGTRTLLQELTGWAAAGVIVAAGIVHLDTLKDVVRGALEASFPAHMGTAATSGATERDNERSQAPAGGIGQVEVQADAYGHFHSDVEVNGRTITAMVDTGASIVALSHEDARAAGIFVAEADYTHRVNTANGVARVAPVTLERVRIGDITIRNVRAAVSEPGRLKGTLLGMSFLSRLSRFEIRQGTLVLQD
ncbi:MAG: TIGR02281 family clan AA aspartic protease [Hyphomicrobiaceae bacterium]|nr:TIGR02281 family clan AA aspartic protease [Hyphomicrobiaceae bacterium]